MGAQKRPIILPTILCFDTATTACSIAIGNAQQTFAHWFAHEGYTHDQTLASKTQELLQNKAINPKDIDAVAVSIGPGSYTGLRIGLAFAKGLCYALNIPLISINTLQILAASAQIENDNAILIPMIDARRMEVYTAAFNHQLMPLTENKPVIVQADSFDQFDKERVYFIGQGAEKTRTILTDFKEQQFLTQIFPDARFMLPLANELFKKNQFVDVNLSEPDYLKEFQQNNAVFAL